MSLRVLFRRAAEEEFVEAAAWYEQQRRGLGLQFIAEIDEAVERAAAFPEHCPVVLRDVRRAVARRFPFAIYFRVRGNELVVLAVFHGRRDPMIRSRRR